ncbi:MAG: family 43 glycosylhydrolase [Pirellulales bacterium]|nr:family 43 glycosylhydrolase [Pirellulales bacterium]
MPAAFARPPAARTLHLEALEERVPLDAGGLLGQYFHNANFTGLAAERIEAVDFAWGTAAPAPGVAPDSYSVRWIGQVEPRYSELYTFRTISDEGVRLWVDGQLLIDAWDAHAARVDSATIELEAGQRYDIRLEYYDNAGTAQMRLQWTSASQPLEAIPATHLSAPLEGLRGQYVDAVGGDLVRVDPGIDFAWPAGPAPEVVPDNFRVVWTGYVRADYSEPYTFRATSDEAVRVWVGDQLIIDHWDPHPSAQDSGSMTLEAGKWYDLRVEYFDVAGDAEARLQWSSERQTGAGQFATVPPANLRAASPAPLYVTNPLGPGADPFVIRWQGSYLHIRSSGGSIYIDKADRLEDVHAADPNSTSVRAWTPPGGTAYSTMLWAPELHQIDGKWYIYVAAAANNDNDTHRMYVLERDNPNPMGSYVFKGQLTPTPDRWAIDGTVVQWQDQLYFVWSGWPGSANGQQNLYIAPMSNPWTISGNRSLLSTPSFSWERHGMPINEGPQVLIHEGQLHIIYSASGYWTNEYALGRLTYDGVGPITSALSWTKAPSPVFKQSGAIVGVGHASFTESPDGTESWIVYHAHHDPDVWQDDRDVLIQPFAWFADGTPNFGPPIPKTTRIEVPSGYADPNREPLAGDYDASGAVDQRDLDVLHAQWGQAVFPGVSADGAADGVVDGPDLLLWQRQLGQTAQSTRAAASAASTASLSSNTSADGERALPSPLPGGDAPFGAAPAGSGPGAGRSWWLAPPAVRADAARAGSDTAPVDRALAAWPGPPAARRRGTDYEIDWSSLTRTSDGTGTPGAAEGRALPPDANHDDAPLDAFPARAGRFRLRAD